MSYKIDWKNNNAIVTFDEKIDFNDVFKADSKIYGDLRFDEMDYTIYNLSTVSEFNVSLKDLRIISTLDLSAERWNKRLKFALIIKEEHRKSVERYLTFMKKSNWGIKIFLNYKDALEWCEN